MFKIELGSECVSNLSGFRGIVTSRSENINGCLRYFLSPKVGEDGKLPDGYWFDEPELEVVAAPVVKAQQSDRGGPPSRSR